MLLSKGEDCFAGPQLYRKLWDNTDRRKALMSISRMCADCSASWFHYDSLNHTTVSGANIYEFDYGNACGNR